MQLLRRRFDLGVGGGFCLGFRSDTADDELVVRFVAAIAGRNRLDLDHNTRALGQFAFEDRHRDLVCQLALDDSLERTSTKGRVVAQLGDSFASFGRYVEDELALAKPLGQTLELNVVDPKDYFKPCLLYTSPSPRD